MDKNPENNLLQTLNESANAELSMTDRPVLIQNQLGIFFGYLKKADTRKGTALLANGYAVDPKKHLTFTQYLRFVCSEDGGNTLRSTAVRRTALENTITDYATEGIAMYYIDTFNDESDYHKALTGIAPSVDLLSLTGIYVIVPVSDDQHTNNMWYEIIVQNENFDSSRDELDMTAVDTFACLEDIDKGSDGTTFSGHDGSTTREAKFSSPALRPLILKEDA